LKKLEEAKTKQEKETQEKLETKRGETITKMKTERDDLKSQYDTAKERLDLYQEMYTIKKEAYDASKTDANKAAMETAQKKYLNFDIEINSKIERYNYLKSQVIIKEAEDADIKSQQTFAVTMKTIEAEEAQAQGTAETTREEITTLNN
jgi:hypothetical protein